VHVLRWGVTDLDSSFVTILRSRDLQAASHSFSFRWANKQSTFPSKAPSAKMAPSNSIRQAEKRALEGNVDSQDSQQLLEMYIKDKGIGLVSVALDPCPDTKQLATRSATSLLTI